MTWGPDASSSRMTFIVPYSCEDINAWIHFWSDALLVNSTIQLVFSANITSCPSEIMTAPHRRLVWLKNTVSRTDVCCWCCTWSVQIERPEHNRLTGALQDDLWNMLFIRSNMKSGVILTNLKIEIYSTINSWNQTVSWAPVCWGVESWNRQTARGGRQLNDMKHLSEDSGTSAYQKKHHYIFSKSINYRGTC